MISFFLITAFSIFAESPSPEKIVFATKSISVGDKKVHVEIADTEKKRSRGLMYRKKLEAGKGMLFIFPTEQIRAFWMKNTLIPLSIAYISKEKRIVDIQKMNPVSLMVATPPSYPSTQPAMYALEVPQGWFEANKIAVGAQVQF